MFDAKLRPLIDRGLDPIGHRLAGYGISANNVTIVGAGFGLLAFIFIAVDLAFFGLWMIILNRVADGLDGAVARASGQTDFGGYLDLVVDFIFYSAIPLAFAIASPEHALAACFLCVSFMGTASSFLGVAILAAKHNISTETRGKKTFFYLGGLTEGSETILIFCAMALWPNYFAYLAWGFGFLCWVTTGTRIYLAHSMFAAR
jgi:phosphatidylglycerophosphate synthase